MISNPYRTLDEQLEDFKRKIHEEFPNYAFSRGRLASKGEDHVAVIMDEAWVFRFPRVAGYKESFFQEVKILEALRPRASFPVPHYEYISAAKDFGGYRLIRGDELTVERFREIPGDARPRIARELGDFISVVHGLPTDLILPNNPHQSWKTSDYRTRYLEVRRPIVATVIDAKLMPAVDRFYDAFANVTAPLRTVIHGDLRDAHIFIDHARRSLAGVIDFGDAGIGDPASDFCFLWSYGEDFFRAAYDQYSLPKDDKFVVRSQWHYVRFLIDQFYYLTRDPERENLGWLTNALEKQLRELKV